MHTVTKHIGILARAQYPIISLQSHEEQRVLGELRELAQALKRHLFIWSLSRGLRQDFPVMNDTTQVAGRSTTDAAVSPTRALRTLFLTLFLRGRSGRGIQAKKTPKSVGQKLIWVLLIYGLFGLIALSFIGQPVFLLSAYLHAMTFIFLGMFIASSV